MSDKVENNVENDLDTISLLDILLVITKNIKFIFFFTLIFFVFSIAINILGKFLPPKSFFNVLPDRYESKAKLLLKLPSGSSSSLIGSSGEMGSLLGMFGGGAISGAQESADFIMQVLDENSFIDAIVKDLSLIEYYDLIKSAFSRSAARKIFSSNLKTNFIASSNILVIGYRDINPEFTDKVIKAVIRLLDERYKELVLFKVKDKLQFLSARVEQAETEYKKAQQNLIDFQKENNIIDITAQASGTVQQITKLQIQIVQLEMEIQQLKEYYSSNDPVIIRKENEKKKIQDLLKNYKQGFNDSSSQFIPQNELPDVSAAIFNLQQEVTAQGTIFKLLREQFEAAKIEAKDNTTSFQILEYPEIPEIKSWPPRILLVIILTIVGFFIAIFLSFIREYIQRVKLDPVENKKMMQIKNTFKLFKK